MDKCNQVCERVSPGSEGERQIIAVVDNVKPLESTMQILQVQSGGDFARTLCGAFDCV